MSSESRAGTPILGSVEALKKGSTAGFVGYPTRYMIGDHPSDQYVEGVDQAGARFTLQLTVPERFIQEAKKKKDVIIPDLASLSETHRTARNPCFADETNGPGSMTGGVFLAEQVKVVDAEKNILSCNWLSVLRAEDRAAKPKIGVGYLEMNRIPMNTAEYEQQRIRLMEMNAILEAATESTEELEGMSLLEYSMMREQLAIDLYINQKKSFYIGVDVQYQRLEALNLDNEAKVRSTILEMIESNSQCGMYGGVIMRPVDNSGQSRIVQVDGIRRLNHQFDYREQKVPDVTTIWDEFVPRGSGWLKFMKKKGFEIEIIPIQRVNCGPISNEKYLKEFMRGGHGMPKQLKAFVDKRFHFAPFVNFANQNAYLACPIAMRNADTVKREFRANNTVLLSSIHAYGKAIGNVLELDKNCDRTLKLSATPAPFVRAPRDDHPAYGQ
ncbi:hypothetical protein [Pseudomonas sp. S1(2024)]|uniref:hypothetical protein n=1 Tax=Pseudomonas sp. S1(2024) TaxID=3390191 RepID=UPI00397B8BB7